MSTMKAQILDSRDDTMGKCYLCKISLDDYIKGLPATYQDYDIQRAIVTNVYLDHLVDTVLSSGHIPPIVLVVDKQSFKQSDNVAEIETFKILDGLQRTFRLEVINKTIKYCLYEFEAPNDCLSWSKLKFSRSFSKQLRLIHSNTDILRSILVLKLTEGPEKLLASITQNYQWFEVWTGLSPEAEVRKMLTLNAGHKAVNLRHQIELLFLNILPILRADNTSGFTLVREKEISDSQYSKNRKCGTFYFAHIITALLSFYEAKPIALTTDLIQSIQSSDNGIELYSEFTNPEFITAVISFLVKMDKILAAQYPVSGPLWMGREVSLAGLFAALGSYAQKSGVLRSEVMSRFLVKLETNPTILDLDQFEIQRNNMVLSKINFGKVNRDAIFFAIQNVLEDDVTHKIDWHKYFGLEKI